MDRTNTSGVRWVVMILMPAALLLPISSQAQEVQRVFESMQGFANDLGSTTPQSKPYEQQLSAPSTGWKRPATPLRITSTYVVTSPANTGAGSLRAAIDSANRLPDLTAISFAIGTGVQTITPLTAFPNINYPVIVDGTTQPGFAGTPIIELNGGSAPLGTNGLKFVGGNSIVKGLVINRFKPFATGGNGYAIVLEVNGSNIIQGNYIGMNAAGTVALPNGSGVGIFGTSGGNTIGGTTPETRNVVSANTYTGVAIADGSVGRNIVIGNYIGTNAAGTAALGNGGNGIYVSAPDDTIGGLVLGAKNVIAGNGLPAVYISPAANRTVVQGNYIGTDATGTINLGNPSNGINIRSSNNIIGDISAIGRNIISGGTVPGIYMFSQTSTRNRIVNNFIGTDESGTVAFPNLSGITLDNAPGNTIGGETTAEGNLIDGNVLQGILILNAGAARNKILSNVVGDIGNGGDAIVINASQDTIMFNTIASNSGRGVHVANGTQNLILGNSIFSNTGMGIDLGPDGLTINDSLDTDGGANNLQNFPLLDSAAHVAGDLRINGRFNGKPNTQFFLDFYLNNQAHSSHFGEGARYLIGGYNDVTDASGYKKFTATIPLTIGDQFLSATSRDSLGNTSEFSQALCLIDSDGDGIMDSWETQGWGMDVNSDGIIDLDLHALNARPNGKDIFVEIDAMTLMTPHQTALQDVEAAFLISPNGGISLHTIVSDTLIPLAPWTTNFWSHFDVLKGLYFGTQAERSSPNSRYILEAKRLVFRYCMFAFQIDTSFSSGTVEDDFTRGCNDFIVSLGGVTPVGGTSAVQAGTFMHELGHTLGLRHGGADHIHYKPNYISVMNYAWQIPYSWSATTSILDYSATALPTLAESTMVEGTGLGVPLGTTLPILDVPYSAPGRGVLYAKSRPNTAVDWDSSSSISGTPVPADINSFDLNFPAVPGQSLTSQDDWSNLILNFRHSPDFSDAPRSVAAPEIDELNLRTIQFLNSLPPPKPSGYFVMDGELDTSATLVATNAGINLYARYKSGQLYVATNSAQSQGADMFIFISDARNPLHTVPSGKTGEVAAWSAFLWNESADNSTGWANATESPQINFTVDTVGTVLEGVIDVEYLYGRTPANLFIAVGKYGTNSGGALLAQVPVGDGDGNIDPSELFWFIGAPPPPSTYLTQQGNKLVGSGAVHGIYGSRQGNSVALSADGNTAIMGGHFDNDALGAAWVFTRSNGFWNQEGSKLLGTGGVGSFILQGNSVALSADGNTAIVGGPFDNHNVEGSQNSGSAWVFARSGNVWSQQGARLFDASARGNEAVQQGFSVALSADGNTAIVGAKSDSTVGATRVYTRSGNVWSQQGGKLVGTGVVGNAGQGFAIALSADGNTAIVGGLSDNNGLGAAWVYTRTGSVWSQQGSKLVGSGSTGAAFQGSSVSISSDGNTAIVGGYNDNNSVGAAWVFTRTGDVWTQQGSKLVGSGAVGASWQGYSVSLSSDGNLAIIGGLSDGSSVGAVWIFKRTGGVWTQQGDKLVGTGASGSIPQQGASVSLSSDGNTAIVGGVGDSVSTGAVWVFVRETPLPIQLASFTAHPNPNGHGILLNWTTLTEINNYGFEIQRSPGNENNYQTLPNSFIPGHGTTNEPQHYSFTDVSVPPGQWYYRLKQIDLDGTVHYSDGVTINTLTGVPGSQLPDKFGLSQNYPDPFNPSTTIRYQLPQAAHVTLKIFNVLGQEVETLVDGVEAPGYKSAVWNATNVASGVYFYRITATSGQKTFVDVRKMLVMK